jgi:hypothetical protein
LVTSAFCQYAGDRPTELSHDGQHGARDGQQREQQQRAAHNRSDFPHGCHSQRLARARRAAYLGGPTGMTCRSRQAGTKRRRGAAGKSSSADIGADDSGTHSERSAAKRVSSGGVAGQILSAPEIRRPGVRPARYLGFDGDPAHLKPGPEAELAAGWRRWLVAQTARLRVRWRWPRLGG